MISMMDGIYRL